MPRIRRYYPASHGLNRDPEFIELRAKFGDWMGYVWHEMLAVSDITNGEIRGDLPWIAQSFTWLWLSNSKRYNTEWKRNQIRMALEWMANKGWIEIEWKRNEVRMEAESGANEVRMEAESGANEVRMEANRKLNGGGIRAESTAIRIAKYAKFHNVRDDKNSYEGFHKVPSERPTEQPTNQTKIKPPVVPHTGDVPPFPAEKAKITKEPAYPEGFCSFWSRYPKKTGKDEAVKIWKRRGLETQATAICQKLDEQRGWPQWTSEGGRYVPNPATYLNQGRWKDEEGDVMRNSTNGRGDGKSETAKALDKAMKILQGDKDDGSIDITD